MNSQGYVESQTDIVEGEGSQQVLEVVDISSESDPDSSSSENASSVKSDVSRASVSQKARKFRAVAPSFPEVFEHWFQRENKKTKNSMQAKMLKIGS